MTRAFMQPDRNARGGATAVWSDAGDSTLFFIESLNVNTDGTRRSYSVGDFWGKRTALNNLCNAMNDKCHGLDTAGLQNRRIITQRAFAQGWPANLLRQTRIGSNIIPFKDGKPCPPVGGFLVSATALHRRNITNVCDLSNYVDALEVPALVLPGNPRNGVSGFAARRARVGDLVVAMLPSATQPVYAVIGDIGPADELGEGSVALNGRLLGKTGEPANYDEVRGRGRYAGRGWQVPRALVLVFPGTRDLQNPYMTTPRIGEAATRRFEEWGGISRLRACAAEYARRP
ncbi:MAG: hypothetical protein LC803_21960 [Acidobacteria bacterium]|nr:hypothetical protein [Acidobacteriota bacterium]